MIIFNHLKFLSNQLFNFYQYDQIILYEYPYVQFFYFYSFLLQQHLINHHHPIIYYLLLLQCIMVILLDQIIYLKIQLSFLYQHHLIKYLLLELLIPYLIKMPILFHILYHMRKKKNSIKKYLLKKVNSFIRQNF